MQGTPAYLAKSGVDFAGLVAAGEITENSEKLERSLSRQTSTISSRSNQISNSVSVASLDIRPDGSLSEANAFEDEPEKGVGMEASSKGKVNGSIAVNYFKSGANWFYLFVVAFAFLVTQLLASAADYWVAIW